MDFKASVGKDQITDYYKILNCTRENSQEQIHHEYKRLCLAHHPDKSRSSTSNFVGGKTQFQLIQEAYEVVSGNNKELLKDYSAYLDSGLMIPFQAWRERKRDHGQMVMHWRSTPQETVKKIEPMHQETDEIDSDELYRKFRNYET